MHCPFDSVLDLEIVIQISNEALTIKLVSQLNNILNIERD